MNKDIIGMIDKTTIFRPSFINSFQGRMYRFMEKFPKGQKFRIIIEPVEKKSDDSESFADMVNKYLESHKPTPEDIERMKEIPPDDLKVMVKAWWDEFILGGDKHENDCESVETASTGT